MSNDLTRRQAAILQLIIESIRDAGYPPTIAEIGAAFRIKSTNGVNDHLLALERKGFITRSSKARGIHVTEKAAAGLYQQQVGVLPLVGRVAAGHPILAEENIEGQVAVSAALSKRKAFCLRVHGDSMIDAGILERDIIIVDQERRPSPGDVVVALIGDEVTVKHFHPHGNQVELRPANATMQTLLFPARLVQIQGVVVALQRALA